MFESDDLLKGENQIFGRQGEQDAAEYARQRGYVLLEQNYRTPYGEIDLILQSPEGEIVFAEVKSRSTVYFGYPETAVNAQKKTHIIRSALFYLEEKYPDEEPPAWRVDIIALIYARDKQKIRDFKWFEDVTADE